MDGHVAACEHLLKVLPPDPRFELIVAEGCAPSRQRNRAARQASGDILYFLDDDSLINPENLVLCLDSMKDPRVAVVGGPSLTPPGDTPLQQLFGLALSSPFGSGAVCNRYRKYGKTRITTDKELILCNLAVRREVFIGQSGFNESLYPNEENEFLDRLSALGHLAVHMPSMHVFRSQRPSLRAFIRQMFNYGRGRAQQTLITGACSIASFIPLFFALYLVLLPLGLKYDLLLLPLVVYLCAALASSLLIMFRTKRILSLFLVCLYPLMHAVNGSGLLWGLVNGKPDPTGESPLRITKIKDLDEPSFAPFVPK